MNVPPDEPWAYLNGQFVPLSLAKLPLYDAGLVQGATVTDFIRTFRQALYLLDEHLERFRTSCQLTGIPLNPTNQELGRIGAELIVRNRHLLPANQEMALILVATPGPISFYAGGMEVPAGPTLALHTAPLNLKRFASYWETGAHLVIPNVRAVPWATLDPQIKHRSRLHWRIAQAEVDMLCPGATALLLDMAGFVTETAAANFLIVQKGVVMSPPLSSILNGVSLGVVRQLCDQLKIQFEEEFLSIESCVNASEAFLTNTSFCLAGVSRLNDVELPWPGPILLQLASAWNEKVGLDIVGQIRQTM